MLYWDWSLESRSQRLFDGGRMVRARSPKPDVAHNCPIRSHLRNSRQPSRVLVQPVASSRRITMIAEKRTVGMSSSSQTLVLYDGICGLCNRLVSFLLRHDRHDQFRFAPLQSEFAQVLLRRYNLDPNDFDTVVVLPDFQRPAERALTRSEAALWAVGRLDGIWRLFAIAKFVPLSVREGLYRFIAQRRYRIFGKYDQCPLPRPEDRDKFLAHS